MFTTKVRILVWEEFPKGPILLRFFTKIRSDFGLILDIFSLDFQLVSFLVWISSQFSSQGWPIFGALLQIWVNCKFQIWGNDPNLGQKLIFKLEIQWENNSSLSHNYSRTCPNHSRIFICASLTTTIRSHRNITKKHVLDNKNFSKYGKLTQIWSNFFMRKF